MLVVSINKGMTILKSIKFPQQKLIFGVGLIFLVAIVATIWWLLSNKPVAVDDPEVGQDIVKVSREAASARADDGDIDGALGEYDTAISKLEGNSQQKKELLVQKADLSQRSGRYDTAIEAAKQAEEIATDTTTTQSLATSYELNGDKENAIIYYKKLIEMTPEDSAGARYIWVWEDKVRELEQ